MATTIRDTTSEAVRKYVNAAYLATRDPALMSWAIGLWRALSDSEKSEVANVRAYDKFGVI